MSPNASRFSSAPVRARDLMHKPHSWLAQIRRPRLRDCCNRSLGIDARIACLRFRDGASASGTTSSDSKAHGYLSGSNENDARFLELGSDLRHHSERYWDKRLAGFE